MKKIINSAGLVALGAASLQAAYGQNMGDNQKPWSVSVAVRGFYDSNYSLSPSRSSGIGNGAQHSFGAEVSPGASYYINQGGQTTFGISALGTMRYYASRPNNDADYTYQGNVNLDHHFDQNYEAKLSDSVVYAQDPTVLEQGAVLTGVGSGVARDNISALHNTGRIDFIGQFTPVLGGELAYNNNFYSYDNSGYSALLDRVEHLVAADIRFTLQPETILVGGYQFGYNDFNSGGSVGTDGITGLPIPTSTRDIYSHYFYGGVDETFSTELSASARVGAQYTDYFNDHNASAKWNPYADGNVTYRYMQGSSATLGIRHSRNTTDQILTGGFGALSAANIVLDQETTAVYVNLIHQFTAKISASLQGQYQNSSFSGTGSGSVLSSSDDYFIIGANAQYHINQYFLAETGYNFDKLDSKIVGRGFTRHVVYLGFRATY